MRITNFKLKMVDVPFEKPVKTAIHQMESVGCACLQLETDVGLIGEGYLFTLNGVRLKSFYEMLNNMAETVIGKDPHFVEAIWQDIWASINPSGHKGVTISALSALDSACWDLIGKYAEKPLHHIFGACRDKIWTYASGGLWLSQSIDDLQAEAQDFLAQGFRAMKIRVGKPTVAEDVARVAAVRDAVGPDIQLFVDANQSFRPKHAIRLGKALEEYGIDWFEEPVAAYDLTGHAEIRMQIPMDLASGETDYTRYGMKDYLDAKACDILMPDFQRIGGYSEMNKVAHLASAYNIPISTHIFTEHSLMIAGAAANCISVEHMPWFSPLFEEEMQISEGYIDIPNRSGIGFNFKSSFFK